jgi:hypothetical protein
LRAIAALSRPCCIVVGEGSQRRRSALAQELGIADRVEFTGPLPQAEVAQHYRAATVFVLASIVVTSYGKRDVIPNVLAEAMAVQMPVVATDVSGIAELISDGVSGRLVPPNDAPALAAVIDGCSPTSRSAAGWRAAGSAGRGDVRPRGEHRGSRGPVPQRTDTWRAPRRWRRGGGGG